MTGSLSVAVTAVSSAKFAVVESGEIGRSAVTADIIMAPEHCLGVFPNWLGRVLCTQFQP
jgi:hypothetical protein